MGLCSERAGLSWGAGGAERAGCRLERREQKDIRAFPPPPLAICVPAARLQSLICLPCLLTNSANPSSQHL